MVREFSSGTKYFIVFLMLSIAFGIFFYLVKKVMEKRELFLIEKARAEQERHGESAILEEQEVQIKDTEDDKNEMLIDCTQYFTYEKFSPEILWNEYQQQMRKKTDSIILINDNECNAKIEVLVYYQAFVKLLRLHVISVTNVECFVQRSDSKSIKLKVMLRKSDVEQFNEVTKIYDFHGNDDVLFDDKFSFQISQSDVKNHILYISVWSVNVFYHEILLGAISIDLSIYKPTMKNFIIENVLPVKKDRNVYGYLLVALCHIPSIERLICVVMSGREMQEDVSNKSILNNVINPFVKVSLINDGKIIKRHKTAVILDNHNPMFNEMIEFYIPEHQINCVDIYFFVLHKYNNKANTLIGKLMLGNHTSDTYKAHWDEAMSSPEQSIVRWHPLTR